MAHFTFHDGDLPRGVALDYEAAIFNLPGFTASQNTVRPLSFYLIDDRAEKAVAGIHFHLEDRIARSPFNAPFGSVEFADHLHPGALYRFLEEMEVRLRDKGVDAVYIKNPPRDYAPAQVSLLETFFFNHDYAVCRAEVGALIEVTQAPFAEVIRQSEKLRMQQGWRAGFVFQQPELTALGQVYDFIAQCHLEKGYKIPVTEGELQKTTADFPDRYLLSTVKLHEKLFAAAISVRVNKTTLYNFLTNHEKEYNHLSPAIPLMDGLYRYCQVNGIRLFDLGTSALQGRPNFSLLDFKLHIGGRPTSKFSFYKKIA